MIKDDAILQTVRRIEDAQANMDRVMEKDRQHLQNLDVRLSNLENQIEALRKAINTSSERTKNKIESVVAPIIESTDRLESRIQRSKMVVLKEETQSIFDKFKKIWKK